MSQYDIVGGMYNDYWNEGNQQRMYSSSSSPDTLSGGRNHMEEDDKFLNQKTLFSHHLIPKQLSCLLFQKIEFIFLEYKFHSLIQNLHIFCK